MATNSHKTIYFRFDGYNEIHSAPAWRLESAVNEAKYQTGVPVWTGYQIIDPNDIDPNPAQDLTAAALSSDDGNISKPTDVSKSTRKGKAKQKTVLVQPLSDILDQFIGTDNLPGSDTDGTDDTISDSVDLGLDV